MNKTYKFAYVQPTTIGRVTNTLESPLVLPNGNKLFNMVSAGTPEAQKQQPRFFSPLTTSERA